MMQHVWIQKCVKLLAVPKLIMRSTCLTHLGLDSLSSLTAFPSSGLPTSLQSLHIRSCENLSFLPPETWSNYTSLVSLELWWSCDGLTSFPLDGFPVLQTLSIQDCRSLDSIYILERSLPWSSSLESLKIESHDSIELFEVKLKMDMLTALEKLDMKCQKLSFCEVVCLPPKLQLIDIRSQKTTPPVTEWGLQYLKALSGLQIGKGDDIFNTLMKESLLPISLGSLFIYDLDEMKSLILSQCDSLTELPVHIGNLVSLRHLDISGTNISELPVEIGGLENLQTLTLFLVGKRHVGLSIKELRKFPNVQGKLTIKNLDNVVDAREAQDANLKSKEKIEELELIWEKQSEDSQKVKVVLDMLQPPISMKSLNICLYGGTSFPSWLGNSSFSNMVSLCISNCEYCATLPPLGQAPSLKNLEICGMKMLESIGMEFYFVQGVEGSNSSFLPFPSLERIKFSNMPNWNEWLPFEGIKFAFPRLRVMELHNCPELRGQFPSNLPCIEEIGISGCSHLLDTNPTFHWLSSIKIIQIYGLCERTQLSLLESDSPCMMQDVIIAYCVELLAVPKLIMRSTCLTHLKLYSLSSLTAFPSSGLPTSLQSLSIHCCENLSFLTPETWCNYTSLVSLDLRNSCDALTSFPLDGFPALQTLSIYKCRSLDSIYILERSSTRLSSLEALRIISHDSIELFEVKLKMAILAALKQLTLHCRELSFCEGVSLPPKLQSIEIWSGITAPPVTEWGLQSQTTLSRLKIGKDDDIFNTLMKESLLPISLVELGIRYLSETKSFDGNGLRHISSLQDLCFWDCKQLQSLPENCLPSSLKSLGLYGCENLESLPEDSLPDSLKELCIGDCPLLEERYKRKEHWSKISHIPVIWIHGQTTI